MNRQGRLRKRKVKNKYRVKDCSPLQIGTIKLELLSNKFRKKVIERTHFFVEERFGPGMGRNPNFSNYINHVFKSDFTKVYLKKLREIEEKYIYKYHKKGFTHNEESLMLTASHIMFHHFVDVFSKGSTSDGYGGIY